MNAKTSKKVRRQVRRVVAEYAEAGWLGMIGLPWKQRAVLAGRLLRARNFNGTKRPDPKP